MLIDIKFVIVFNRIGHGEDMFLWRSRSPSSSEFWFVFSCSCWRPLWVTMLLSRNRARVVWCGSFGFPVGYWWTNKCRNNNLSIVVVPIRLRITMVLGHYWRSVLPDDVIIIQLPVPSGWAMGLMYRLFWKYTFTQISCNLNLREEQSSCGGLYDSGTVGVCAYIRMYILTLERGDRSGYLLLLPLLHMLKVMDDGVHMPYTLWHVLRHVHYDACQVSYDAFIS